MINADMPDGTYRNLPLNRQDNCLKFKVEREIA